MAHATPRPAAPRPAAPCCSNSLAGSQAAIWIIMCLGLVMYMCAKQPRIAITTAAREGVSFEFYVCDGNESFAEANVPRRCARNVDLA